MRGSPVDPSKVKSKSSGEWLVKATDVRTHSVRGCTSQRFGEAAIEANVALTKFSRDSDFFVNSMCFRNFRRSHKTTALAAFSTALTVLSTALAVLSTT